MPLFSFFFALLLFALSYGFLRWHDGAWAQSKHWIHQFQGLASGIFLGLSLFHFIPESAEHLALPYPVFLSLACLVALAAAIACAIWLLDHTLAKTSGAIHSLSFLGLSSLFVGHALLEGLALGHSRHFGIFTVLWFAVLLHKGCELLAFNRLLRKHFPSEQGKKFWQTSFALLSPLGMLLPGSAWAFNPRVEGIFELVLAATFLYLAALESHQDRDPLISHEIPPPCRGHAHASLTWKGMLAGVLIASLVAFFGHQLH